jgi:DNA-directed RNA polymerase specialized sigma subunit
VGSVRAVARDLAPRLRKAADDVADARKAVELALERRDKLIVQARTEGMSQTAIATHARVSQPHIVRLLAAAEPGLLLPS